MLLIQQANIYVNYGSIKMTTIIRFLFTSRNQNESLGDVLISIKDLAGASKVAGASMTHTAFGVYYYDYTPAADSTFIAQMTSSTEGTSKVQVAGDYTTAMQSDVRELRVGNIRYDFSIATVAVGARNVEIGMVDYMTIKTKIDSVANWSSPTSTKVLYFWYDSDEVCIARKESN